MPGILSMTLGIVLVGLIGILALASSVATIFPEKRFSKWLSSALERRPRHLSDFNDQEWFSLSDISIVEKYIPQIESVVVISSFVQNPNGALWDAVMDNFQQGARYAFYVSKSGTSLGDFKIYRDWFESIFKYAKKNAPDVGENSKINNARFGDHFGIMHLDFDWHSAPYIFYTYMDSVKGRCIVAFRGDRDGVGICDLYRKLDPNLAADILNLASAASHAFAEEVSGDYAELEVNLPDTPIDSSNVIPLIDAIRNRAQNR